MEQRVNDTVYTNARCCYVADMRVEITRTMGLNDISIDRYFAFERFASGKEALGFLCGIVIHCNYLNFHFYFDTMRCFF